MVRNFLDLLLELTLVELFVINLLSLGEPYYYLIPKIVPTCSGCLQEVQEGLGGELCIW